MKIVLREDVDTLGRKGDLLEVADGYARNYLVPRGLAMKATKGVVAQAESMRRSREVKESRDRDSAQAIAAQRAGDWATYGAKIQQLGAVLERLATQPPAGSGGAKK